MKRSALVLMLLLILLSCFGCSSPHPSEPGATADEAPVTTTTQPEDVTPEEPTQTQPQPTTQATEPTTGVPPAETTTPTETVKPTEATKPTETVKPTEATKPSEPKPTETTKPTEHTKPVTPTKPVETTTPTETTAPPETEPANIGWVETDGKRYYYNEDGSLHTGWLTLDGDRYYFYDDGPMALGKVEVPGSGTRYFTSTGKECILVNPWNYVPADYSVKLSKYGDYKVAKICLSDLKEMLADCKSAGSKAVVVSAYRSHSYQQGLYERRIQRFLDQGYDYETAVIEAGKRVAVPGTSEHELGLALDIVDVNYQNLDKKQEDTAAQKWLMANSWKYGFILRYPNEKSDVTGIIYEPWHYRYVGKELAKELHDSGLCLEEYFASLT